ncbi:MAG: chorismate mutase [Candidatus Lokiarchaeota archaeon]|nr:chorismate mutase [Candidatus Lokiarchaeota archaeon]
MEKLETLQKIIDEIDLKIADLIEERMNISKEIGLLKTEKGIPIINPEREAEIIKNIKQASSSVPSKYITAIWNEIMKTCRIKEQGQFLTKICIESSSDGTNIEALDTLIETDMKIFGEEVVFNQLGEFDPYSYTRYLVLSKNSHDPTESDKTSIIFVTLDKPGQLSKVIGLFAEKDVNLTKIESRSRKLDSGEFEYVFFLEFDGNSKDSKIEKIFDRMKSVVKWMKVLGSYPKAEVRYG